MEYGTVESVTLLKMNSSIGYEINHKINSILKTNACHERSNHSQLFFKVDVPNNFTKLVGKDLCWRLFLNYQKGTQAQGLSCEFCEIFKK